MPEDLNPASGDASRAQDDAGVNPCLCLDGRAAEAADFYAPAFGGTGLERVRDAEYPDRSMRVQVEITAGH